MGEIVLTQAELQKKQVGSDVAQLVTDGMTVGLGTGSTVRYFVEELGRRVATENLTLVGVTTSDRTADLAERLNIPLRSVDQVDHIDLTVDGADAVDDNLNGIKGGGAALLYEKIVAKNSNKNIWIVDRSKMKPLGGTKLPVEVIQYGAMQLLKFFKEKQLNPVLRVNEAGETVVTDNGNYIIDLWIDPIDDPYALSDWLSKQTGVVEHGLFLDVADEVWIGGDTIEKRYRK